MLIAEFEEDSESQVLCLNAGFMVPKNPANVRHRMTREMLRAVMDQCSDKDVYHCLDFCWIPRRMFDRWLHRHGLPKSPEFFEPQKKDPVARIIRTETRATEALAAHLKQNSNIRRRDAKNWCLEQRFSLAERGFLSVWREARRKAGLLERAPAGRKPK